MKKARLEGKKRIPLRKTSDRNGKEVRLNEIPANHRRNIQLTVTNDSKKMWGTNRWTVVFSLIFCFNFSCPYMFFQYIPLEKHKQTRRNISKTISNLRWKLKRLIISAQWELKSPNSDSWVSILYIGDIPRSIWKLCWTRHVEEDLVSRIRWSMCSRKENLRSMRRFGFFRHKKPSSKE